MNHEGAKSAKELGWFSLFPQCLRVKRKEERTAKDAKSAKEEGRREKALLLFLSEDKAVLEIAKIPL